MNTPGEEVGFLIQEYEDTGKSILKNSYEICMASEGTVSREDIFRMSFAERELLVEIIKEKNEARSGTSGRMMTQNQSFPTENPRLGKK